MRGSIQVPFSELFADTVQTHGAEWARAHYTKRGMQDWEFQHWMRATKQGA